MNAARANTRMQPTRASRVGIEGGWDIGGGWLAKLAGAAPGVRLMRRRSGDAARPLNVAAAALSWFARRTAPPEPAD